jgi:reverse transcriptase-like protein
MLKKRNTTEAERRREQCADRGAPSSTGTRRTKAVKATPSESPRANFAASASFKAYNASIKDEAEPLTFREAMESLDAPKWRHAMKTEVFQLQRNKTWQQMLRRDVPPGAKVIPGKWVYRLKRDANGKIIRWKARWVAKGYEQRHGIDYDQTFAGVTKSMTWKAIIAMAATRLGNRTDGRRDCFPPRRNRRRYLR